MPIVKVGDQRIKFPDSMSSEEIQAVLQKQFPQPVQQGVGEFDLGRALGGIGERIRGGLEAAGTLVSGAIAEPVAGLAGTGRALLPGQQGVGAQTVESVRDALTFTPRTERGRQVLQSISGTIAPIIEPLIQAGEIAGGATLEATGSPALAAGVQSAIQGAPDIVGTKFGSRAARTIDTPRPDAQAIREATEATRKTGVELFQGQQDLNPSALGDQSFVQQLPAGAQTATKALAKQNQQALGAVDAVLAEIAPDDSIIQGAERFRTASARAVERAKQIRKERTSPLYKSAFDEGRVIPEDQLIGLIDEFDSIRDDFPESGEVAKTLRKATGLLESGDLQKVHNAKLEIDQMISKVGEGSLGNTTKAKLLEFKDRIVGVMDSNSPLYREARDAFAAESPAVNAIENSMIGKIANLDDTQLKGVSTRIFDPQNVNVKNVTDAKKVIQSVDPDAWDMLMRAEIERRMGSIKPDLGGGIENIPGKLSNAIFGSGKQRAVIMAGADGKTKKALESLDTALRRASLGRGVGSQTAAREAAKDRLKGGIASGLRDLLRSPIDTVISTGETAAFDRRVSALSEALFDARFQDETISAINNGRGRELAGIVLSIETAKQAQREREQRQALQQQAQQQGL